MVCLVNLIPFFQIYTSREEWIMRKLILIGNGFDLAHGLKTSYKDFSEKYYDHPILCKFRELAYSGFVENNVNWYDFEANYEEIVGSIFDKNFCDDISSEGRIDLENKVKECNKIFENLAELLKEYLKEETSTDINKLRSVQEEITYDTHLISFNYTDTAKLYSQKCSSIHGSISEDDFIILGFAEGNVPDAMGGSEYIRFYKEPLKEKLNFIRYLNYNSYNNKAELMQEFDKHLNSLFSGYGGYDVKYDENEKPLVADLPEAIQYYAESNDYCRANLDMDIDYVKEVVVMGHGLESDTNYIRDIFERISKLEELTLFTYHEENPDDLCRKKDKLKQWSGLSDIVIKHF